MDIYTKAIYRKYSDLLKSGKKSTELDNNDLAKIFEYYSCIKLSEELNQQFYMYSDIDGNFKEENKLTQQESGIDCCNMIDTIVQCKLRKNNLCWQDVGTFFGSQNIYCEKEGKIIVRWPQMIITRNSDSKLAPNLRFRQQLFLDRKYDLKEMIEYCEKLVKNPPKIKQKRSNNLIKIRDYQKEAINLIIKMKKNLIVNLPTGCGKNFIVSRALKPEKFKYLILVPRVILLEQIENELTKYNEDYEDLIQRIGDGNNKYNSKFDNDFLIASIIAKLKNKLILISTRKVYRNSSNISENSKIAPACNYSKNKKISEIKCDKILKKRLIIIRTSNIIGIKNKSQHLHKTFIDNFFDYIKKGKIQYGVKDYKDFVSINQFCDIIYRILINKNHLYGVFNLSINKKIYIRDIVSWLLKYCSKDIKIIEKKKSMFGNFTLNNDKLSKKLNYLIKKK